MATFADRVKAMSDATLNSLAWEREKKRLFTQDELATIDAEREQRRLQQHRMWQQDREDAATAQAASMVGPATTAGLQETMPNTLLTDAGAFGSFVLTKMRPRSRKMPSKSIWSCRSMASRL